jgi:hypothetical protein
MYSKNLARFLMFETIKKITTRGEI